MTNKDFLVDPSVFKKTPLEKLQAKEAKLLWQRNMRVFYGPTWRKHSNYPAVLKERD
jgi:hypothetical protein